jgi:hypothetical protein
MLLTLVLQLVEKQRKEESIIGEIEIMSKDVLELEEAGEILKLYAGNEKDEIICLYGFNEYNKESGQSRMGVLITAEPTGTNILVRCQDALGYVDLPADNTEELKQVNLKRKEAYDALKTSVEKRKAEYLKAFEAKGFRVLLGAWIQ